MKNQNRNAYLARRQKEYQLNKGDFSAFMQRLDEWMDDSPVLSRAVVIGGACGLAMTMGTWALLPLGLATTAAATQYIRDKLAVEKIVAEEEKQNAKAPQAQAASATVFDPAAPGLKNALDAAQSQSTPADNKPAQAPKPQR